MPPKKRQIKSAAKNEANRKKKKASSSDSEFDSDFDSNDNGNVKHSQTENAADNITDEHIDESMYPKESPTSGRLLVCGGTNWDLIGRKELPKAAKNAPNISNGILSK